jgi:tRNA (mo5U34)-methyltransferase
LEDQLAQCQLPDLRGRTVLDIGAWDGFFSFYAERNGAARVVALDHFVWSIDFSRVPVPWSTRQARDAWHHQKLPGKRGFDLAHRVLDSRVETMVADFMETDLSALGQFEIVLYLGVLYHQRHPLLALERLAQVTREVAIIETEAIAVPRFEDRAFCQFFETDELAGDSTNWWSPNARALVGMCRAAGFREVELQHAHPHSFRTRIHDWRKRCKARLGWGPREDAGLVRYRLVAHAFK